MAGMINLDPPEWSIAIPSYKRHEKLCCETMRLLIKHNIQKCKIFVFVADESESLEYLRSLSNLYPDWEIANQFSRLGNRDGYKSKIVVGKPGISAQRRFINSFFPLNHHIVSMDDDMSDIKVMCSNGAVATAKQRVCSLAAGELQQIIEDAGVRMLQSGSYIWSVSLSQIPFHLQICGISTAFGVCVGYFFGCINRKLEFLETQFGACGDDVERSLRYINYDKLVLRYKMLCCATKFREGQGGINSEIQDRKQKEIDAVSEMSRAWPEMIQVDKTVRFKAGIPMKILRSNFPKNKPLQTSSHVPGIRWVPPAQRTTENLPQEYLEIISKYKPILSRRQSQFAPIDEAVKLGKLSSRLSTPGRSSPLHRASTDSE